jgi:hypothetical protein
MHPVRDLHVPIRAEDRKSLMQRIERLRIGTATIYSPNAALDWDEIGNLITGTSRFISVNVRRRVTSDGGESVLAV